ncbi:MAG: DUF349 domain-containing protein [Pseudomonadota bacterium]|nr:DUF349 domain-containing protein [Pseudomonadota bacterium]
MSSKSRDGDSSSSPLTATGPAVPIAAKQPPSEQGLPQSTSDSANLDTPLALQTSRRTTPAEDLERFPDQVSRNLVNESPGDGSQESVTPAPASASGRNESASDQKINSAPESEPLNFPQELNTLENELIAINDQQTTRLITVENRLNRLRKLLPPDSLQLTEALTALTASLQPKLSKNAQYQLEMEDVTKQLICKLEAYINAESLDSQIPTVLEHWRSIQDNLSNSSGDVRARIKEMASPFKEKIQAIREQALALAAEKKKSLIQQMEMLHQADLKIRDRAQTISKLHQQWKVLGRSSLNDELWQQFKTASDQAYEPCKAHFKARKQEMAANFRTRKKLCDSLEEAIASFTESPPDIAALNQLLREADSEWKKSAPVEQSKIKSLQKRYYGLVGTLRKFHKKLARNSAAKKASLILQAQELIGLEDKRESIARAKALQQDWKTAGPASYKEDKRLWEQFREACDKIFSKPKPSSPREAAATKSPRETAATNLAEQEIQKIFDALQTFSTLSDEELRTARGDFNATVRSFTGALDHRTKKQRSQLIDQFNHLKRSVDARFRALPDKKSQLLMNRIGAHTQLLEAVERKLLTGAEDFSEVKARFDTDAWQKLEPTDNTELDSLLQSRASYVMNKNDPLEYQTYAADAESRLRELCILLEIRAGTDTPESDQAERMSLQLAQLQSGFGRKKPSQSENIQFAHHSRLLSLCLGPIEPQALASLQERLNESCLRLLHR